jgi:hypothetical protein
VTLSPEEFEFLQACDQAEGNATVADLLKATAATLSQVRQMQQKQLVLLRLPQPSS